MRLDDTFFALSSSVRRQTLQLVKHEPKRLVDLSHTLQLSLPALHKHIAVLERADLIYKKKIGRERFVTTNVATLQSAEDWIKQYTEFWNTQFDTLEKYINTIEKHR